MSFSKEVLKPADGGMRAEAQQGAFDVSALPDGVTAIPVADPDDPSLIVMQVSCYTPAMPARERGSNFTCFSQPTRLNACATQWQ